MDTPIRQIVALGGGMFSMEPGNGLLDKYLLNLVPKDRPKICFLGTASNDGMEYRNMFYNFFEKQQCEPSHLALTDPPGDIEAFIMEKDIIHVGGGNTKLIMDTWKKFGVDKIMRRAWDAGIILSGMSAGAICWFDDGITNPSKGKLTRLPCLGLLNGSFCPHYDDRAELKDAFRKLILEGTIEEGYGAEDGTAIHFVGTEPVRVITSRPGVTAYKVTKIRNKISEAPLPATYIGKNSDIEDTSGEKEEMEVLNSVISFVEKINDQDVEGLAELMSDDHVFTDSSGIVVRGKKEMINAWSNYFKWFPDYEIIVKNTLLTNDSVGIFGIAKGTFGTDNSSDNDKFEIPAAWRAKVKSNLIAEWQVFADNEVVRDIIKGNGAKEMIKEKIKVLNSLS
ncbi:MAG: Type 1 glutamine amidotransferase-like domain-containing protein [Bacteroidota bacterium]|nr:Type 1 glutamine amidotransferase-like domain-containing protein [Bacteroidota bacterium]